MAVLNKALHKERIKSEGRFRGVVVVVVSGHYLQVTSEMARGAARGERKICGLTIPDDS